VAPTLEALMATHDELDAIEQIKKLKARYFRCMDTKDWDGFQAVFADDASMDTTQEAPNIEVVVGAPQIRQFVEGSVGPVVTVHHGHMPEIEVTGPDTARGTWAMFDFVEWPASDSGERVGLNGYGHYLEEYAREDGEWRIARIRLERLRVDRLT
jgi:SnoaL-like domain